jgi:hypothetical protein
MGGQARSLKGLRAGRENGVTILPTGYTPVTEGLPPVPILPLTSVLAPFILGRISPLFGGDPCIVLDGRGLRVKAPSAMARS